MIAAKYGIKPTAKKIDTPESQEAELSQLMVQFPQDPMTLPKGDLTIGSGKKRNNP